MNVSIFFLPRPYVFIIANALTCFCLGHCPDSPNNPSKNGTCETPPNGQCFKAVEQVWDSDLNKLVDEDSFGCIGEEGENDLVFDCLFENGD